MYMPSCPQSQYSAMHTPDSLPPSARTYQYCMPHMPSDLHSALPQVRTLSMFGDFHPRYTDHHTPDTHLSSSIVCPHSWCTLYHPHSVPLQLHKQSTVHEHHCQTRQLHLAVHMPDTQHRMVNTMPLDTRHTMCAPHSVLRLADKRCTFDVQRRPHSALRMSDIGRLLSMFGPMLLKHWPELCQNYSKRRDIGRGSYPTKYWPIMSFLDPCHAHQHF